MNNQNPLDKRTSNDDEPNVRDEQERAMRRTRIYFFLALAEVVWALGLAAIGFHFFDGLEYVAVLMVTAFAVQCGLGSLIKSAKAFLRVRQLKN